MIKIKEKLKFVPKPIKLKVRYYKKTKKDVPHLTVSTKQGEVFGPQPFLAIQTKSNRFIHDNFDFSKKKGIWHYAFYPDTLPINDVLKIGIGTNDKFGNTSVTRIKFKNKNKVIFY